MKFYKLLLMCVILLTTLFLQSCGNSDSNESISSTKEYESGEIKRAMESKYMYRDNRNVWHIDQNCIVLSIGSISTSEDKNAPYSVMRSSRLKSGWIDFSCNHWLCPQCFTDEVLEALEEGDKQKDKKNDNTETSTGVWDF